MFVNKSYFTTIKLGTSNKEQNTTQQNGWLNKKIKVGTTIDV